MRILLVLRSSLQCAIKEADLLHKYVLRRMLLGGYPSNLVAPSPRKFIAMFRVVVLSSSPLIKFIFRHAVFISNSGVFRRLVQWRNICHLLFDPSKCHKNKGRTL
ncbi:hypothetical protein CEXT_211471 [Caerostris extrusa]|uniref:Uncharacterized protein n=1 Tax=Caerostris extrusa TaxID=172846 RepID=A0AAV4QDH6_CAEEX|nr:hypothetical protein CEXT_211471 [Caerostris extrusa]